MKWPIMRIVGFWMLVLVIVTLSCSSDDGTTRLSATSKSTPVVTATPTPSSVLGDITYKLVPNQSSAGVYSLPEGPLNSELQIHVDGTLWTRVGDLLDYGPSDRVYVVGQDSEGTSNIRFGDGEHGSRLPSRSSNVVATYLVSDTVSSIK